MSFREYRAGPRKSSAERAYRTRAKAEPNGSGKTAEAITLVRNKLVHSLTERPDVQPETAPLYPGESLYPSEHLNPGMNLCWRSEAPDGDDARVAAYRERLSGRRVLPTLEDARDFLAGDPGPV